MAELQDKFLRLRVAIKRLEEYTGAGLPQRSPECFEITQELVEAFADLMKEFGHEVLASLKR